MTRTIRLYPFYRFCNSLLFSQAVWFLMFQAELSAAAAVTLYVVYDVTTTLLEVPSGYASDRLGRRLTLILSATMTLAGMVVLTVADSFLGFALGQALLGAGMAFSSGTDSALLFEALQTEGREDEIAKHELRAWRASYAAFALSALSGGALAVSSLRLPYAASVVAGAVTLAIVWRLQEPPRHSDTPPQMHHIRDALRQPILRWLLVFSLLTYAFSHLPFVFGQPFIDTALTRLGLDGAVPLVSGAVSTSMMLVALGASLAAPMLRQRLGLFGVLLLAFAMQVGLVAALALSNSALLIGLLIVRMVPGGLSRPYVLAEVQTHLNDSARATYLSLQSLAGRVALASTLFAASQLANDTGVMAYDEIKLILGSYAVLGMLALSGLALWARRLPRT